MGWLQVAGLVLSMVMEIFKLWKEKNDEIIKIKKEALKDAIDAVGESDVSKLSRSIERLR